MQTPLRETSLMNAGRTYGELCRITDGSGGHKARCSIQPKALPSHERAEIGAERLGIVPRLVLRPAIGGGLAPALGGALAPIGPQRLAAAVVGVETAREIARVVAILVQGRIEAEPRRDVSGLRGPADAEARDRDHALGKLEQLAHHIGAIADGADRTTAEPDRRGGTHERGQNDRAVDDGVEEQVEMIVGERLVAQSRDRWEP